MQVLGIQVPLQSPPAAPVVKDRFKDTPGGLVNRAGVIVRVTRIAPFHLDFRHTVTQFVPELLAVREAIMVGILLGKCLVPLHPVIQEIDTEQVEIFVPRRRASVRMADCALEVSEDGEDQHMIVRTEQNSVNKDERTHNYKYNTNTY